jgi:hypothetical protein
MMVSGDVANMGVRTINEADASWASGLPGGSGYCIGLEDGRVLMRGMDGPERLGPYEISPSGEAVNGVAFAGDVMAVSTRSDVAFLKVSELGKGLIERAVFYGGAHGVIGTPGGSIVAPLGREGILWTDPVRDEIQKVRLLKLADVVPYAYKVVGLARPERGEVIACAGRRGGFVAIPLSGPALGGRIRRSRPDGADFVDVAALDSPGFPFAMAALGLDCSIHFVSDISVDMRTLTLHCNFPGERAYRLLCAEGHVFMLTDKRLHAFAGLASRFLSGEPISNPVIRSMNLEAIDVSVGPDRSLLVVMPDSIYCIDIDPVIAREGQGSAPREDSRPTSVDEWEGLDAPDWQGVEEMELARVA